GTPLRGQRTGAEVVEADGRVVARSLRLGGRVLPGQPLLRRVIAGGPGRYAGAELGGEDLRVYAAPLADVGGPAAGGAVAVATSTPDLDTTLASVHVLVLVAALVAAAVGAAAPTLPVGGAMRPLGGLAEGAAEIEETGDPKRRLPEPASDDEVGRLARTLNGMLGALDRSREAERRFLADASHELRTPLTALVGNVSYLARHGASDELIAELERDTRRLATLADDLLALSREEAAPRPADLVRLDELARATEDVVVQANRPVSVRGDRAALERALANLVENARRHGSGRITVEAAQRNRAAFLTVADEGPGLTGEEAEQAFAR